MSNKKPKVPKITENGELEEMKNLLVRLQADFENYRKRTQKEKEEFACYANTDLILRLLPVLDNFKLAEKHRPAVLKTDEWANGILHIERQLEGVIAEEGISEIPALGQKFNHNLHEAVEEVPSEKPPGEIIEVILPGYKLGEKIIRHAKVKVSKGKSKGEIKK